ncbi:hypothetical protein IWW38_004974, partial [Coemansia aciculifera]
ETANNDSDDDRRKEKRRKKDEKKKGKKKKSKDVEQKSDSDAGDDAAITAVESTETVLNAASVRLNRLSHRTRFRNMKKMALQDEKGLQEIFGVRSAPSTFANTPDTKPQSGESTPPPPVPSQTTTQTVETGVSVSDYFAQKLAANPALAAIYGVDAATSSTKPIVASSDSESLVENIQPKVSSSKKRKADSTDSKKDKKRDKEEKKKEKRDKKTKKSKST